MKTAIFIWLSLFSAAILISAHPVHGHQAFSVSGTYDDDGGLPPSWSFGDITFTDHRYPAALLTEEEKYMIVGAPSSSLGPGALLPWENVIFLAVDRFYDKYEYVPAQLTPEILRSIPGLEQVPDSVLEQYRNPLTDAWPRLNATSLSPGDIYVKRLSQEEKQHFAEKALD